MAKSTFDLDTAAVHLREDVRSTIFRALRAGGRDAVVQRRLRGSSSLTTDEPASPADAVQVARLIATAARGWMREYARKARGAGVPWHDLAGPLGIEQDEDGYNDLAAEAFLAVAEKPSMRFDPIRTSWRCDTCQQYVTDSGPNGHPVDCERGHAEDCARHLAEITAYESRF
jgi:hypothetical protein